MTFKIGERIGGRYEVYQIAGGAGRSGMGTVYVCYDHNNGGAIALKTYQQGFFHDKSLVNHFKRGALAWIKLDRFPYIVQAYGVYRIADQLFIGLEYIAPDEANRNTINHHIRDGVTLEKSLAWGIEFCDAMEHVRVKGITPHRDIKPDNLMVTHDDILKVSDFDLAGVWTDIKPPVTDRSNASVNETDLTFIAVGEGRYIVGTPPWMAPEQFDGITSVQSDIYSFGIVLYQLASNGSLPYRPGQNGDWGAAHKNNIAGKLDSPLWPVIERCLAKNPADRYGGNAPEKGFLELRDAIVEIWKQELPDKKIPVPPEGKALEAEDHSSKGASLTELGLFKEAIKEYKKALALNPEFATAYLNAGVTLAKMGEMKNAEKAYNKAIHLEPTMAEAHNNLGLISKQEGRLQDAEASFRKAIELDPKLIRAYENIGVLLSESGRHDEAIKLMQQAVKRDPGNPGYHYSLGVSFEKGQRYEEALKSFQEAVRLRPTSPVYQYGLGNGWRLIGNMENAVACWKQTAYIDPGHTMARFNLGIAYEDAGQLDTAYHYYREAINTDPAVPNPHYNIALVLAKNELFGEGADAFEKFLAHITPELQPHADKAKELIAKLRKDEEVVQENMKYPEQVYNRGRSYLNLNRLEEAKQFLERAIVMRPEYPSALTALGIYYEKLNDFTESVKCHRRAVESDTNYALAWNNLGWTYYLAKNYDEALKAYSEYIMKAPQSQLQIIEDARHMVAKIRDIKNMDNPDKKTSENNTATSNDPVSQINDILSTFVEGNIAEGWEKMSQIADNTNSADMQNILGEEYFDQGKFEKALDLFFKAMEIEPENTKILYNIGRTFIAQGEFQAAIGHFEDLIEQFPDEPSFPYNLAQALRSKGDYKDAIRVYEETLKLDSAFRSAHLNIGVCYDAMKEQKKAMNAWREEINNHPDNAPAHFNLAQSLEKMNFNDLAIESYRQFIQCAPANQEQYKEHAKSAIARLGGTP